MSDEFMAAVYSHLTLDAGGGSYPAIYNAVGGRIYAFEAPASSALPLMVYSIDSPSVERFFDGTVRTRAIFSFSIFGKTDAGPAAVGSMDSTLFDYLDDKELTVSGHDRGVLRGMNRGGVRLEGDYYRADSTFEMVATSTA